MSKHQPIKIEIKKLNLVSYWTFDLQSQNCDICRNPLVAPPSQDLISKTKTNTIDMSTTNPVLGDCGHAFHKTCIDKLIVGGSCMCPIDHSPWAIKKYLDAGVTWGSLQEKTHHDANPQNKVMAKKPTVSAILAGLVKP